MFKIIFSEKYNGIYAIDSYINVMPITFLPSLPFSFVHNFMKICPLRLRVSLLC